jgi:signal transduction histidine kinase/CheY-like chemotaxis protein
MSSRNAEAVNTSRWFTYLVTVVLGIAFAVTLVSIAWNNALEETKAEFSLGLRLIRDNVERNVRIGHNSIRSVAAFFAADPNLNQKQFKTITSSLFSDHAFIKGVIYCQLRQYGTGTRDEIRFTASNLYLRYQDIRDGRSLALCSDIFAGASYRGTVKEVFTSDHIVTAVAPSGADGKNYWLLKSVKTSAAAGNRQGFVGTLLDTQTLLGSNPDNTNLSITLISDTADLSGRRLLYSKSDGGNIKWPVSTLAEETITQFPSYSIKLAMSRRIPWAEVNKELVYNALLLGVGITLLIGALVRAKDQQEIQLRERNIMIEKKVEEQTKELALARDHALKASRVKSDFLASMSHEIRTPLNAIIGMAELLAETPLSDEQKKYTDIFRKAGDTLLSLVNDILDLSKIEAGQLVLEEIEFDIDQTLEESIEIYALKAAEKDIELLCDIDPQLNCRRVGDPARLRQIILNLISNALKFTEHGEIVVSVINDPDTSDTDWLRITVSDTGIGIPASKLDAIFASFTQVDSSTTRKYGGTGLGLTICRSLVDMMNGKIWVESEENVGSRFIFTAWLPESDEAHTVTNLKFLKGRRILVVDDNDVARDILCSRLKASGATADAADSGRSALQAFEKQGPYDLVLTDYTMPEMNGLELAREIKSRNAEHVVFLVINSFHLNQSLKEMSTHGIDGYLVKPVKYSELLKQIIDIMSRKRGQKSAEGTTGQAVPSRPLRILLVDDNSDNRLLVRTYLKKLPYELDEAENGKQALERFQAADYDIVLMDVQMPVMDGKNATRKIREWETSRKKAPTPVIALTAHAIKEEIDECMRAGCSAHLGKPVKKTTLIECIQAYT